MPERYHKRQRIDDDTDGSDVEGYPLSLEPPSSKYSHLQEKAAELVKMLSSWQALTGHYSTTTACMEALSYVFNASVCC